MFRWLDLLLMDYVFQPLTVLIYKMLGLSNFSLARWALMAGTALVALAFGVMVIAGAKDTWAPTHSVDWYSKWVYPLSPILVFTVAARCLFRLPKIEREHLAARPQDRRDGTNTDVRSRRFFLLMCCIYGPLEYAHTVSVHFATLKAEFERGHVIYIISWAVIATGYYFMSCMPPPPRRKTAHLPINAAPVRAN